MSGEIKLPGPNIDEGYPLIGALKTRRTRRRWSSQECSAQELSNILWAGCGVTLVGKGKAKNRRTAPSASNAQEISIYVARQDGLFHYDEGHHALVPINGKDLRGLIGTQKMMKSCPLGLIYVADFDKLATYARSDSARARFVAGTDTGFISQNIYLYCAAAGLATVIIGMVDRKTLHDEMGLGEREEITFTQAIGALNTGRTQCGTALLR